MHLDKLCRELEDKKQSVKEMLFSSSSENPTASDLWSFYSHNFSEIWSYLKLSGQASQYFARWSVEKCNYLIRVGSKYD